MRKSSCRLSRASLVPDTADEGRARILVSDAFHRFVYFGNTTAQLKECLNCMDNLALVRSNNPRLCAESRVMLGAVVLTTVDAVPSIFHPLVSAAARLVRQFRFFCEEISEAGPSWETLHLLLRTFNIAFAAFEPKFAAACRQLALSKSASQGLREDVERVLEKNENESRLQYEALLLYRLSELTKGSFTLRDLKVIRASRNFVHYARGVAMVITRANAKFEKLLNLVMTYAPPRFSVRPGPLHRILTAALQDFARSWALAKKAIVFAEAVQELTSTIEAELRPQLLTLLRQRGHKQASVWLWRLVVVDAILYDRKTALGILPRNALAMWGTLHKRLARLEMLEQTRMKLRLVCPHRPMLRQMFQALKNILRKRYASFEAFFHVHGSLSAEILVEKCDLPQNEADILFSLMTPAGDPSGCCTFYSFLQAMKLDAWWSQLWTCKICLAHSMRNLDFDDDLLTQVCTMTDIIRGHFPADFLSDVAFLPYKRRSRTIVRVEEAGPVVVEDSVIFSPIPTFDAYEESQASLSPRDSISSEDDDSDSIQCEDSPISLEVDGALRTSTVFKHTDIRILEPSRPALIFVRKLRESLGTVDPLNFFLTKYVPNLTLLLPSKSRKPSGMRENNATTNAAAYPKIGGKFLRSRNPVRLRESASSPILCAQIPAKRTTSFRRVLPFARIAEINLAHRAVERSRV